MGEDRYHRQYWVLGSSGGVLVESSHTGLFDSRKFLDTLHKREESLKQQQHEHPQHSRKRARATAGAGAALAEATVGVKASVSENDSENCDITDTLQNKDELTKEKEKSDTVPGCLNEVAQGISRLAEIESKIEYTAI